MRSVIFGFSKPKSYNLLSDIIEKVEKRPFSHAYTRFKDPVTNQDVVFQATGIGVNLCLFEAFKTTHIPVEEFELPMKDEELPVFWSFMLSKLDTPYSVLQLIYILVNKVFHTRIGSSDGEICSELAAKVSGVLGKPVSGNLDYETPSDLEKFCKENMQRVL